jgi:hypothetical protein
MIQNSLSKRNFKADAQCVAIMFHALFRAFRKLSQVNRLFLISKIKNKKMQNMIEKAVYNSLTLIMT